MPQRLFSVTGHKISSLLLADDALRFSSQHFSSAEAFEAAWHKKLSLATKVEVRYATIRAVHKDEDSDDILIKYKTVLGIPTNCEFSFPHPADYDTFFTFLLRERYFTRQDEKLTPLMAIANYLLGIAATIGFFWVFHLEALDLKAGTVEPAHSFTKLVFDALVGWLGPWGVLAVGALVLAYLLYKAWGRFSHPPHRQRFLPPNA